MIFCIILQGINANKTLFWIRFFNFIKVGFYFFKVGDCLKTH